MRVVDPVSFILRKKGTDVWSVPPDATVYDAMQMMADKDVGALLIMDGSEFVGVVSERDYARKVILQGRSSKETPVREIATETLITITPECSYSQLGSTSHQFSLRQECPACQSKPPMRQQSVPV